MTNYYVAKLKYQTPKEESDEMKKESKSYLVHALSVTEVEAKLSSWIPSNFQDPEITGVQESKVIDLITDANSETYWEVKMGDENEKGKLVPFLVIINGDDHFDVLKRMEKKYSTSEFIAIKKINTIVDDDLVAEGMVVRKADVEVEYEVEGDDSEDSPF